MIMRKVLLKDEILIEWDWVALRLSSDACGEILRTCQQIHNEGAGILYGENVLAVASQDVDVFTNLFLPSIGPHNVSMIRHIKFNVDTLNYGFMLNPTAPSMIQLHPQLSNLRQMTWEILWEIALRDASCISACMWHGTLYSQQLPHFSREILFEARPRNPRVCIMKRCS